MRLIVGFGYRMLLFPTTCELSPIIEALGHASVVEEDGPWGARFYKPVEADIEIKLISDGDTRLPDVARTPDLEKIISLAKERDDALRKIVVLETKLKKIQADVAPAKESIV